MHSQARLLGVFAATREAREARRGRELVLAINRSDYMLDEASGRLLQVAHVLFYCMFIKDSPCLRISASSFSCSIAWN